MNVPKLRSIPGQYVISNEENTRDTDDNMLKFPNTKNILWDHTCIGSDSQISISYYRKPRLCISEKVLRFAHRHIESKGQAFCGCALVGQLTIDDDGEGIKFTLDRFDPGGDSLNSSYSLTPGDMAIPFQVVLNSKNDRQSSSNDYLQALQLLKQRCCSKNPIDLSNFLLTKGWCNTYTGGDKCVHHLEFDVVTLATELNATPINPVPIVPTALSKNLSGPMSMSHLQGEPKTGYLTMDHTRKVLLVLESDPKVVNLPLVGIWVSGVSFVYSPYIWACCLRFMHNSSLNDRICVSPDPFLLVLYNPLHSKPEFYEISPSTGSGQLNFDLFNGYEVVNLPKTMISGQRNIEMDIGAVDGGQKKEMFDGAIYLLKSQKSNQEDDVPVSSSSSHADEMTPRNIPAPHKSQLPVMTSMVPEVSLLFGEDSGICVNPKKPVITQGKPIGVNHTSDFSRTKLHPNLPVLPEHKTVQHSNGAQQKFEQSYPPSSIQGGRLAQHYMNAVPRPVSQTGSLAQDTVLQNRTSNSNPMSQNRNIHPNSVIQNNLNPDFIHQNKTTQQFDVNSLPNNYQIHSGQRLPQTYPVPGHQQFIQPYPQYAPGSHPSMPYGQQYHNNGYVPISGATGFNNQPSHLSTQQTPFPQQATGHYPQNGHIPQQFIPNQQGMMKTINMQQQFIPIAPQNQQIPVSQTNINQRNVQQDQRLSSHGDNSIPVSQANSYQRDIQQGQRPAPPVDNGVPMLQTKNLQRNIQRDQRPSPHSDSSKSSDDSGLSVTPEKQNPLPKTSSKNNTENEPNSVLQSKNINWNQVPPEVYQLLVQQDSQLKKLQEQIQMLITNQSNSSQNTTTTELDSGMTSVNKQNSQSTSTSKQTSIGNDGRGEMCSVAVNTTMFYPPKDQPHLQSVSLQTSPQKPTTRSGENTPLQTSQCSGDDGRTPAEIRHRGVLPFNSTQKDDFDLDVSQDLSGVVNNMALHDKTIDSIQSEMIVDMPSYHSSPTRSDRTGDTLSNSQDTLSNSIDKSPTSASMCGEQEDSGDEQDHVDTNDKEYYDQLMNNIQLLLNQQSAESGLPPGEITDTLQNDTLQQSIMLGQYINSIQHKPPHASREPLETTFIPKINYMSMMFDSDSDSSMEINAMAMKYLKDEQLTQMNKLQTRAKLKGNNGHQRVAMLRHILSDDKEPTPNVSSVGMSPNDMTFATRKYMEKHGLINNDSKNNTVNSMGNDSYKLRVDYSIMSDRSESPIHTTHESENRTDSYKTPVRQTISSRLGTDASPYINSHNMSNSPLNYYNRTASPTVNSQNVTNSPYVNSRTKSQGLDSQTNSPFINSKTESPMVNTRRMTPSLDSQTNSPFANSQTKTPSYDRHTNSPFVNSQTKSPAVNAQGPPENHGRVNYHFTPSPGMQNSPEHQYARNKVPEQQEVFDYRGQAVNQREQMTQDHYRPICPEDDDKILDITRLRMLPKLL